MTTPSILWFRRDLRLADHPALIEAAARGPVIAAFVLDAALWGPAGANRRAFLGRSLTELNRSMGGALVIRAGSPDRVLADLAAETDAHRVVVTEDFGPYGRQRDAAVAEAMVEIGCEFQSVGTPYAVAPGSVVTGSGTSYKVFTPFFRAWKAHGWLDPQPEPEVDWVTGLDTDAVPTAVPSTDELPPAGEAAAWDRIEGFLAGAVTDYVDGRDRPGIDGTSRLSSYLKWGTVHPRQLLDRLGPSPGEDTFRSELAWREFYAEVLFQRPETARKAFIEKMGPMEVDDGPDADARFEAWCRGETGFPIVDAGMRQLVTEGWMHNRVRMIVASFVVKDLHLDWSRGARFFMEHLVDGDLASNSHGWQWVAGTGTDASPYFRVFNPVSQSRKFDPGGAYLRRWVPEIAHLSDKSIHEPWNEKAGAPAGYPLPVVDHAAERIESLARYDRLKQTWA